MKITHHPDTSTLMSFAAGALPEALSAVVASHAALCPACRRSVKLMDQLGGAALAAIIDASSKWPATAQSADAGPTARDPAALAPKGRAEPSETSAVLAQVLKGDYSSVRWRRLGIGIWHVPLPLSSAASGDLRLLKVAPGMAMPDHGHSGSELSLILCGSYTDTDGTFGEGDFADLGEDDEHMPVAATGTGCVCLIASERPAKFKGLFARIVQPFIGL